MSSMLARMSFFSDKTMDQELQSLASSMHSSNSTARSYNHLIKISEGGFSTVYKGQKVETKNVVAIKKIKVSNWKRKYLPKFMKGGKTVDTAKSGMQLDEVVDEVNTLKALQGHDFILTFYDSFKAQGEFWVVTEYTLGDLHALVKNSKKLPKNDKRKNYLPLSVIRHILAPIFVALKYMHEHNIIHRDIKEDNVLVTAKGIPKLCDFGSAKTFQNLPLEYSNKGPIGSFYYMAPEILRTENYYPNVDSWSLGVTILSLMFGDQPFSQIVPFNLMRLQEFLVKKCVELDKEHEKNPKRVSSQERFNRIASLNEDSVKGTQKTEWLTVRALLKKMMILDKKTRISVADLCDDPWVAEPNELWTQFVTRESGENIEKNIELQNNEEFFASHDTIMQLVVEAQNS